MIGNFRPKPSAQPPPEKAITPEVIPAPSAPSSAPQAEPLGTGLAVIGLLLTGLLLSGKTSSQIGHFAAYGVGFSLAASALADLRRGPGNLIRADIMAIAAFFFLTMFEFFFEQLAVDTMIDPQSFSVAVRLVLAGMAGLLIGRHLWHPRSQPFANVMSREIPPARLVIFLWCALLIGFSSMLIAVHFNVFEMVKWFMSPRFTQPWSRGRFGDWRALLYELNMLIFLVPPLAGVILARRSRYRLWQLGSVAVAVLFVLFYGFASGTRNLFASYLVTFFIAYAFALPGGRRRELVGLSIACAVGMGFATTIMLKFRDGGLTNYLSTGFVPSADETQKTIFIDYSLCAIARLSQFFPKFHPFLGLEVPYVALVRPIPRALWPGKPEGLSLGIEQAMGVEGMTIATTFVGEAYMAGGIVAVFLAGLIFGAMTGWWNHLWSPRNSELGILIYASGFFAAVISMRSMFVFTTALLPTFTAIVIGPFVVKTVATQIRRLRGAPPGPSPRRVFRS